MALVDQIAHRLADEMCAERPTAEPVLLEERAMSLRVARVCECRVDLEVVTPARQLESVEAPGGSPGREIG